MPFFDHMLQQLGKHAGWDLAVTCEGDLEIDGHHTVEDCGIALGEALAEALGDKAGVRRFASIIVPLDEAAVEVVLDLAGRNFVVHEVPVPSRRSTGSTPGCSRTSSARSRRPPSSPCTSTCATAGRRTTSARRSSRRSRTRSATRAR